MTAMQQIEVEFDRFEEIAISQAIRVGDLVFISGQAASRDDGGVEGIGDFEAQCHKAFDNLTRVLEAAGSSLASIAKVTIFVTDMGHYDTIVAMRRHYFTAPYPADSIVEVRALARPELMVEIEAVAVVEGVR